MKITILNGSPRHNGNTQIMADTFSETARENGHTVNILNIANMNIRGCLGCKYCYSHGGKCVQDGKRSRRAFRHRYGCFCITGLLVRYDRTA